MQVDIEKNGCISCGLCVSVCPEVFQMGDDGLAEVHTQPAAEQEAAAREAAENCPVAVIYVE